jgi:hypothetical protein
VGARRFGQLWSRTGCSRGLRQPKTGKPDACYAVWRDGKIELKSFHYPYENTIKKIEAQAFSPEVKLDLITVLKTGSI